MAIDGTNEAKVGWVWSGNNRSTFDVLWSCLAVILVCTYKVIHLNLPARTEAEAPWYQLLFWKKWSRKLKWMGFMALSPELLLSMALADFLWSRQSEKQFAVLEGHSEPSTTSRKKDVNAIELAENGEATSKKRSKPNSLPFGRWTRTHGHYADMGGFNIRFSPEKNTEPNLQATGSKKTPAKSNTSRDMSKEPSQSIPLFAAQVLMLVKEFSVEVPYVTKEDIKDRSKSDAFAKMFAIGQSTWLIIQCVARAAQGLPITQLELATMGFVGCALLMYILWWHKPFNVELPVTIDCPIQDQDRIRERLRTMFEARYRSYNLSPSWDDLLRHQRIPNWAYMDERSLGIGFTPWLVSLQTLLGIGMAFSALHLSAWNWTFPTTVERYLWRAAALVATVVIFPMAFTLPFLENGNRAWQHYVTFTFEYPLAGIYLLCRTILMIQTFLCFRAMPEDVYKTVNWTAFVPHFS